MNQILLRLLGCTSAGLGSNPSGRRESNGVFLVNNC